MRNTLQVLKRDFIRLFKAPAALVVAVALIVLPSLYAWFNVYGFWNPYDNTGNMHVCVVNEDEGAYTSTTGRLDLGNQIVDSLRENDQLGWEFTDREDAMNKVRSGQAYAAFVIPANFSSCITTFLTGDIERPKLEYYVNEKAGAVSPKITDTGANTLDQTINSTFVSTVSGVVAQKVDDALARSGLDIDQVKSGIVADIQGIRNSIATANDASLRFSNAAGSAKDKASKAKEALERTRTDIDDLSTGLEELGAATSSAQNELLALAGRLSSALDRGDASATKAALDAQIALHNLSEDLSLASADVDASLQEATSLVEQTGIMKDELNAAIAALPQDDPRRVSLETALGLVEKDAEVASSAASRLGTLSKELKDASTTSSGLSEGVDQALSSLDGAQGAYRQRLSEETLPTISANLTRLANTLALLSSAVSNQTLLVGQAITVVDELEKTLGNTAFALDQTNDLLVDLDHALSVAQTDIASLSISNALDALLDGGSLDVQTIMDFMLSPTELKTEVLYPLNAYGSAMAPLFMNLTLWIGVFMLLVILKHEVDDEGIPNLTSTQRYLGRLLFFAPFAVLQAIVCCTGILIIGVQTANVFVFFVTAIIASLTYLCIQFALVVTMQHIGMGLCIVLVFVQIPGATGLYPIEMTPDFFRVVYPMFPFTYGINALREAIAGFYSTSWGTLVGYLFVFMVIFFLIGLLVRPYMTNLNRLFAREIKETGIINGEDVQTPPRRFRAAQIFSVLAQREETRERVHVNMDRFIRWYPTIIRGLVALGIGVPAVATFLMSLLGVEKVVLLTLWLIWLLIIIAALVIVAYIRDNLTRLMQLNDLSEEELRDIFANRDNLEGVPVSHMRGKRRVPRQ